jgi:hypothetical protein
LTPNPLWLHAHNIASNSLRKVGNRNKRCNHF